MSKIKLLNNQGDEVTIEHSDTTSAQGNSVINIKDVTKQVDTIADLKALDGTHKLVYVTGYHTKGDGAFGSHFFEWDATSIEADNGGTIIKLDGVATGRYKLKYEGSVNAKWFGVVSNGVTDDTQSVTNMIANLSAEAKLTGVKIPIVFTGYTYLTSTIAWYWDVLVLRSNGAAFIFEDSVTLGFNMFPYLAASESNNICSYGLNHAYSTNTSFPDPFIIVKNIADQSIAPISDTAIEFTGISGHHIARFPITVHISGWNVGMKYNDYAFNIEPMNCNINNTAYGFHIPAGLLDAGERLSIIGGTLSCNKAVFLLYCRIMYHLLSCNKAVFLLEGEISMSVSQASLDYCKEYIVYNPGGSQVDFFSCHVEQSMDASTKPLFYLGGGNGTINFFGGNFIISSSDFDVVTRTSIVKAVRASANTQNSFTMDETRFNIPSQIYTASGTTFYFFELDDTISPADNWFNSYINTVSTRGSNMWKLHPYLNMMNHTTDNRSDGKILDTVVVNAIDPSILLNPRQTSANAALISSQAASYTGGILLRNTTDGDTYDYVIAFPTDGKHKKAIIKFKHWVDTDYSFYFAVGGASISTPPSANGYPYYYSNAPLVSVASTTVEATFEKSYDIQFRGNQASYVVAQFRTSANIDLFISELEFYLV